jgi:hypothetical protein
MAGSRIKDWASTRTRDDLADDSYVVVDGLTQGSAKVLLNQYADDAVAELLPITLANYSTTTQIEDLIDAATAGASRAYAGVASLSGAVNITSAHAEHLVGLEGAGDVTLVETAWTVGRWVDLINIGTVDKTVTAGTNGINRAGNDSFVLSPDSMARLIYSSGTDPMWRAEHESGISLTANQYPAINSGGTLFEARDDKRPFSWGAPITADGTYPVALWPNIPTTLSQVRARTISGTCSIQLRLNGGAFNGFGSAVAQTTTVNSTASTQALAEDNLLEIIVTSASSLTGLVFSFRDLRTGN